MTEELRSFLTERRIRQIEENELLDVYLDMGVHITSEFTLLLYECGMNPLEQLNEVPRGMFRNLNDNRFRKIIIPSNIKHVRAGAFRNAIVDEVIIEEGCEVIHSMAFAQSKIKKLTVPSTCKTVMRSALRDCFDLEVIKYNGTKHDWQCGIRRDKVEGNYFAMGFKVECTDGRLDTYDAI